MEQELSRINDFRFLAVEDSYFIYVLKSKA